MTWKEPLKNMSTIIYLKNFNYRRTIKQNKKIHTNIVAERCLTQREHVVL